MKVVAVLVFGLCSVSCGGGSSSNSSKDIPQDQACEQGSLAACTKLFKCSDDLILTQAQILVGGSVAACQSYIKASYCATFECSAGQTYHGDKAAECKNQFGSVSCATLSGAAASGDVARVLASVPGCEQICTAGSGDAATSGG